MPMCWDEACVTGGVGEGENGSRGGQGSNRDRYLGAHGPRGGCWLLLQLSEELWEDSEQSIVVMWLMFYRITLATVLTRDCGGARVEAGRPGRGYCTSVGE